MLHFGSVCFFFLYWISFLRINKVLLYWSTDRKRAKNLSSNLRFQLRLGEEGVACADRFLFYQLVWKRLLRNMIMAGLVFRLVQVSGVVPSDRAAPLQPGAGGQVWEDHHIWQHWRGRPAQLQRVWSCLPGLLHHEGRRVQRAELPHDSHGCC